MKKNDFPHFRLSLLIIFVFLIKGRHGFFIKHSGTGLCIKPTNTYFDSGTWGQMFYVEFYDNCLHSDAQFRYVDNEYVVNIGKDGTLIARVKKRYQYRFLVYHPGTNQLTKDFLRRDDHTLKQTASGSLITYQGNWCAIPKTLTTPAKGDQLIRTTTCNTELQKFTFGSVTNKGATMVDVSCATTQKMEVVMAEYGVFSNGKTFDSSTDADCSLPVGCKVVKGLCDGKTSCGIAVDNRFTFNQCPGTKRLHMEYQCVDNLATPITSVSDVRLSTDQNKGFVEVFNGATWKKLSDKSWDKRKQAALCRHLGYSDRENDAVVKNISSGEMILSGDLYCQHRNQSCCAYLYPSTSTAVSNMAYAKCKICDDPLLQNSTRFPDGIFSANDGNGYDVRLSNNGWCSTISASSYLQIDLKRDFFISYIATFGDKARTKWLESYELKYSSIASDLDSKTAIMITANHDGYRASITRLDILYARYLKIIPKSGNDFCLRVELCGQVLLPDPVSNVVVSKATKTANVSWSVPQIEGYGGVTYFLVFLNGTKKGNLTRDKKQYTFNNLELYTSYTVTIEAGNAYGVGESVSKTFVTDDPGFFIKHSESGLCVKPKQTFFASGTNWGSIYYVEFHDGCLHPDAQFHFIDKEYVQNIAKDGTLLTRNAKKYLDRFLVYHGKTKSFIREKRFRFNQKNSGSLSMYSGSYCAIPHGSTTPSEGTYLKRTTTCNTDIQKFTFGSVTSHGASMVDVSCATTQKMVVVTAEYGAFKQGTFKSSTDADCSLPVACKVVKGLCDGKTSCGITVNSTLFPFNQCPGTKRLHMEYRCVDSLGTPIKSVSKVRLSHQADQGFVEVLDGTTWRKVNDENWDKRKQTALCHHLGYNESDVADIRRIGAVEDLASGALYCQGIKFSDQSCCAYFYSSKSTAESRIPYVKCKICNESLLQNSTRFPDSVFSASVGNGYEARLTNNGWCFTGSGTPWLQIDLQKDYYISHITTFGDKDQTKWVMSYSLQYSRTESGLGSKGSERTIKANDNAYRASMIKIDIVYARYLKLTTIKGNNFCIRVELCGHVLLPDPVQNVVVGTITARSALVSWSVPQNEGHGGVTYFLIFLNGTKKGNVTRKDNNNQYTLNDLKPYSNYEVTIEAGNVYGVGESFSKTFRTKEAAPEGPPLNVVVVSQNTSSLRVTWSPPHKNVSNGIITRYKICHSTVGAKESCDSDISPTSHDINNLQAATKYILRISAGTKIGYGTWTPNITKITNQELVKPTVKTYFSLEITLETPRPNIQSLLIIVQAASSSSKITDHYQSNELQPYQNSSVPYVTAGLSVSSLPKNFAIGDNKLYNFANVNYVNQPLKQDTEYIVFLRFIGTGKIYYSTEWSAKVKTFKRPEAPLMLKAFTLSSSSLNISWEQPKLQENVQFLAYSVCYEGLCNSTERTTYLINDLKPGTEYEVRVCSVTTAGNSEFNTISKFTNDAPLVTQNILNHNFEIVLPRKRETFNYIQVIVQAANRPQRSPDQYLSKDLKSYHDRVSTSDPYITAQLQSSQVPSKIFTVGDAKWYNSTNSSYYNKPLEQEKFYIVFARYFENETKYYSSYWPEAIKTILIPAPRITNIDSYGKNSLNISWRQPDLPSGQTTINYIITYWKSENVQNVLTVVTKSSSLFHILNDLEYETKYFIQVQTRTEDGKSAPSTEVSKTTNAEPLSKPKKEGKSYTVTLRKPRKGGKVDVVKLIVLQLQSESTIPTPPEKIKLDEFSSAKKSDNNMAFVVTELRMSDFTDAKHDVILQVSDAKRRRKRSSSVVKGLLPGVTYRTSQGNYDDSGAAISQTSWSPGFSFTEDDRITPAKTSGGTGLTGVVVGIVVAVLLILLAVVGFVFWRRRSNNRYSDNKAVYDNGNEEIGGLENGVDHNDGEGEVSMGDMSDEGIYSNETGFTLKRKHPPVPISAFAHYVNEMKAKEDFAFTTEYEDLPATSNTSWEVAKRPYNKKKNRYGNIVTYDHSRVNLSGDEDSDYINASFIDGVETNSYIACQGPTKYSLDDMWRMVWEQRTYSIVMVTSLIELGKPKCDKYWPDQGSEKYGDIEVTLVKTEEFACHETRTFQIKKDDEEREVKHYYFSSWPDHGVPKYPTQLLAFRRHFRTHHLKQSGPIIVHCSAGVGRTGVFLAIDSTLEKIEKGLIESIDIFGQVSEMRTRRMNMIQTMEQYKFVHEAILETILCGMNEVDSSNISQEIKNLSKVQAGGMTGFQEKFKRLGEVSPIFTEEECTAGLLEGNQSKNRSKNIYPAESSRVNISHIDSEENSDYINAVFVHGYLGRNYFIATQTPLPNTVNDFWRMVHEQKSSVIVLLNNVKDGTSFPKFWSSTRAQPKQYGDLTIQLESAVEKDGIVTRKFMLSAYADLQDAQVVKIFHYTKWHDHCIPEAADVVITLTSLVEKSRHSSEEGPVIVVCSDGAGRSGTFIAISNLIERMKIEQVVDVFQSIKIIRASRPQFVENADQYQFCYSAVSSYLDAFSEYSNFE